ncbi:NADPH-dependent F420 reductase [Streptomyces tsukubensis]|uniref:NADP oxidoreductase n=1 Tax=Streptomyces tsukubensis TaxID=83656 RepID=A0A1V4A949_9ACTN|nr:NAD(P)-binding domain-containing protein [Streptomyces tsukubensis]OON79736.1 NADP oxidoreductase [Streptomyces tsukubensis]QFR98025.1 NADP oxidoreductase [Streptomyces tsukubensis]
MRRVPARRTPTDERRKATTMKIGIIGAGNIGSNLTRRFTAVGHEVALANSRGPETLDALAKETGATPVLAAEAARGARVVVVTIPLRAVADLPAALLDGAADDVVVIDTNNYYPYRDGRIAAIEEGLTESRWVAQQLGHTVIKAFNTIIASNIIDTARPRGSAGRVALPVAGDDEAAKRIVLDLVDEIGFDAIDAGGLDESWRQQPGTPSYGLSIDAEGIRRTLAEASPERSAEWRA